MSTLMELRQLNVAKRGQWCGVWFRPSSKTSPLGACVVYLVRTQTCSQREQPAGYGSALLH